MLEFYFISDNIRTAVIVFGSLGLTALALAFTLAVYCLHKYRARIIKTALIFCALCQTFICCTMIAQTQMNAQSGFFVPSGYFVSRYVLFGVILALSVGLTAMDMRVKDKSFIPPVAAAVTAALTLPVTEALTGAAFPYLFIMALAIWFACGGRLSYMYAKELRTTISNLSIKQAMDSYDTSVMFYKRNGRILLLNNAMQKLMVKTSGTVFRSGTQYMESVSANAEAHEPEGAGAEGRGYLYRLPDGETWLYTLTECGNGAMQATAADVTEQERAASVMKEAQVKLEERNRHLKGVIENIEEIRRDKELIRMKSNAHDQMGQKLSILMNSLRQGKWPGYEVLASISADLLGDMKHAEETTKDPEQELNGIVEAFGQAGNHIYITGKLPEDRDAALVLTQIIHEAAVNAVTHGYANEIYAEFARYGGNIRMTVADNNPNPPERIEEGVGISDMRRRLGNIGGCLEIALSPRFTLIATISEKGKAYI